ncbi:MAG: ATP-binding protein [Candidatus Kryptoniota bacterium]
MYTLLEGIEDELKARILNSATERHIPYGTRLFEEGEVSDSLFIIKSGEIELRKKLGEGEIALWTAFPGDFLGEMAVIDGLPRSASAVAIEDSIVASISSEILQPLLSTHPKLMLNISKALTVRLRRSNETLATLIEKRDQDAHREIARLNALIESAQIVNSSLDIDRLLQIILDEAIKITDAERGTIYIVDEEKKEIWSRVLVGNELEEVRQPVGKGISGYVAQTGKVLNISDAYSDPRFNPEFDKKSGFRTQNVLCVPMKNREGRIIGVCQLINKRSGEFSVDDERYLQAFTVHAAIAIENSRIAQEMVESERLSAVGRMAGSIIHDIKNPMSTIRVYAQVIKKKSMGNETAPLVDEIIKQIDRLVNMAQEVLDFSRGTSVLKIQKIKYDEFINGVLLFIKKDFEKKGIVIENNCGYNGDVEIDPDKITRVILNIAGNAADAMPDGGHFIINTKRDGSNLKIEMIDTGTGMPDEVRKKIFEPFMTYGKKHGTGLGMAIVKKILDDHNATIEVESKMGKGTKMTLYIPISHGKETEVRVE